MPSLLVVSSTGFAGFAALLPVAPLWAVSGGASEAGSGLVNSLLMASTIVTQLVVARALNRWGWGPVLMFGMVFLGAPSLLHIASDSLVPILAISVLRGVGFGILTVVGAAAVGLLVDAKRRGEAIGIYGLAIAVPNLILLPITPWISEEFGFTPVARSFTSRKPLGPNTSNPSTEFRLVRKKKRIESWLHPCSCCSGSLWLRADFSRLHRKW